MAIGFISALLGCIVVDTSALALHCLRSATRTTNFDADPGDCMLRCTELSQPMSQLGHLRPSRAIPSDGSLSPDSCRARRMLLTAALGPITDHAVIAIGSRYYRSTKMNRRDRPATPSQHSIAQPRFALWLVLRSAPSQLGLGGGSQAGRAFGGETSGVILRAGCPGGVPCKITIDVYCPRRPSRCVW